MELAPKNGRKIIFWILAYCILVHTIRYSYRITFAFFPFRILSTSLHSHKHIISFHFQSKLQANNILMLTQNKPKQMSFFTSINHSYTYFCCCCCCWWWWCLGQIDLNFFSLYFYLVWIFPAVLRDYSLCEKKKLIWSDLIYYKYRTAAEIEWYPLTRNLHRKKNHHPSNGIVMIFFSIHFWMMLIESKEIVRRMNVHRWVESRSPSQGASSFKHSNIHKTPVLVFCFALLCIPLRSLSVRDKNKVTHTSRTFRAWEFFVFNCDYNSRFLLTDNCLFVFEN